MSFMEIIHTNDFVSSPLILSLISLFFSFPLSLLSLLSPICPLSPSLPCFPVSFLPLPISDLPLFSYLTNTNTRTHTQLPGFLELDQEKDK